MRLSELSLSPPPPNALVSGPASDDRRHSTSYQFPYPSNFLPVPYHTDTTISHLLNHLIPLTRSLRSASISTPVSISQTDVGSMDLDGSSSLVVELQSTQAEIKPDGLLLYVAQATYEPGTSPLSTWVPIKGYESDVKKMEDGTEVARAANSPLDVFER